MTHLKKTLAIMLLFVLGSAAVAQAQDTLDAKQQAIIPIAVFSSVGDMDKLPIALGQGLDAGLTINEIKEMLVQLYAYAGYPRSLNAVTAFRELLEKRKARGIRDVEGRAPSPMPADRTSLEIGTENQTKLLGQRAGGGIYDFVPILDEFLKAHLFGDIFQRDNLDWKSRELMTIGILSSISGVDPQLKAHIIIGMHNGITVDQIRSIADIVGKSRGQQYADNVNKLLDSVLKN